MTAERPRRDVTALLRDTVIRMQAIACNGLAYTKDPFDADRFHNLSAIATELHNCVAADDDLVVEPTIESTAGYTTPKLDVRAAVFRQDGACLLVREKDDGRWAMPGGWCDVLESPSEAVAREVHEETGLAVDVVRFAALVDRDKWNHQPPLDAHVYKLFFVCTPRPGGAACDSFDEREILDVQWFDTNQLPALSTSRLLPEQVQLAAARWADPTLPTYFD